MIYFPSCKINLGLNIVSKRSDGFHDLESGMLEIPVYDAVEMVLSDEFAFTSSGLEIHGESNLCIDAFRMLQRDFDLPEVKVHLLKNIPMGAGLGGGSSDAAFVLKLTDQLFGLGLSSEKLESYAAKLGSDCAFFINGGFQYAEGRGEILSPLENPLSGFWMVIINPGIHVSTKEAFSNVKPDPTRKSVKEILQLPVGEWKNNLSNDFEKSVFPIYPELKKLKERFYEEGAVYASMSGSGSTMYGVFQSETEIFGKHEFAKVFQL